MIKADARQSPSTEVDADLAEARRELSLRLGEIINELADRDDVLFTMVWGQGPVDAPAWFDPRLIKVTINGTVALDEETHPDDVDPQSLSGRLRHPVIIGMAGHEAAHARSTRWGDWPPSTGRAVIRAAVMLEEPRIELRHLQERPDDQVFLRACASTIVLPGHRRDSAVSSRWQAASAAALVLARVDAGVLTAVEVKPVLEATRQVLGTPDLAKLRTLWRRMLKLKDGDQEGMLAIARRWVEVVGADEDDDLPGVGCAAGEPAADGTGREDQTDAVSAAVAVVTEAASTSARIATGAMEDPQEVQRRQAEAAHREAALREEESAREDAKQAAHRVFAPAPSDEPDPEENPVLGRRAPRPDERSAARHLGKTLDRARFRAPVRTRVASAMPPGRLSGRDAMLGAAQRAMGLPVTARPFRSIIRQRSEDPPVAVGVAVDVSGSMAAYTSVIASTAWIFAHGTRTVAGKAATVAFGSSVTPIVAPGQPPAKVTEFSANQGTHRFTEAARALDGALSLSRPHGARLLVIVSDGHWETRERHGGARVLSRLAAAGVHVLWFCLDPRSNVLPGAHRVDISSVSDIPSALAAVLVSAIRDA